MSRDAKDHSGASALPSRSSSTPILSVESSPEHNPGPVTISEDLQVMSPRGSNFNSLGRATSQQDVRPEDVPVSSSIPASERNGITIIQPVFSYHTSNSVTFSSSSNRAGRSTSPSASTPLRVAGPLVSVRASSPPCEAGQLVPIGSDPNADGIDTRNVRRRISPPTDIVMRQQSETPQKTALRAEMHAQQQAIEKLRARVQDVQGLALSEMETQQRSFENVASRYEAQERRIKHELFENTRADVMNEARAQLASLRNEEFQILI